MTRKQHLDVVVPIKPHLVKYLVDTAAEEAGCTVVRLLPNHCAPTLFELPLLLSGTCNTGATHIKSEVQLIRTRSDLRQVAAEERAVSRNVRGERDAAREEGARVRRRRVQQ
ncbi:hypothetical protein HPB47_021752 [Ixodes persulcatus]|uniref:Uncharacterized protein n=1 Tax=Ixodes persulcatus TaxID=34615 RepID=A0AC60QBP1_IXOPE|nr:hypothetical protein HPB47_021752 [Ixodes persulcatus]